MAVACDFLVVAVALTEDTAGLVDRNVLQALGGASVLVNVSRGGTVDEEALYDASRHGQLGGAALDVWYSYPKDSADHVAPCSRFDFASLPNVWMTPHISGWTEGTVTRRIAVMANNLVGVTQGSPLTNVVRPAVP